jgi:hypothetical protein
VFDRIARKGGEEEAKIEISADLGGIGGREKMSEISAVNSEALQTVHQAL